MNQFKSIVMKELIEKVKTTAGVTEEQAKGSINAVTQYLKERMPQHLQSQVDSILTGERFTESTKSSAIHPADEIKNKSRDAFDDGSVEKEERGSINKNKTSDTIK